MREISLARALIKKDEKSRKMSQVKKTRKKRSDSKEAQTKAMANAIQKEIPPPEWANLTEIEAMFWGFIIEARPLDKWDHVDQTHAVNLSRCFAAIDYNHQQLLQEGETLENNRGTPVQNPRQGTIETLTRRSVTLSRLLHIHPEAKHGESRHQRQQKEEEDRAREAASKVDGDDLIARPGTRH